MNGTGPTTDRDLFGRPPTRGADWSHRRSEPRGLALGWTVYLMLATMGSLAPAMSMGRFEPDVYRPAARILMAMVVVGLCVLWPMFRASQSPVTRSPARFVVRDMAVVLLPALTLVWPQVYLAGWSADVVGALTCLMIAWTLLVGCVMLLWHASGSEGVGARAVVMAASLGLVAGVPLVLWRTGAMVTSPPGIGVTPGWMWSPVTAAWEVLRDRSWTGRPAWVWAPHWSWAVRLLIVAVGAFVLCVWSSVGKGPRIADRRTETEH